MSERTFFSLRYTLPGYTFILWNLLINLRFVVFFFLNLLPTVSPSDNLTTLFGILLGFLTLLSGGAIGFLVSQFYHLLYFRKIRYTLLKFFSELMIKEFEVKDEKASLLVYNYILHSYRKKGVFSYVTRGWDLINVIGSTGMAICLGSISGLFLRVFVLKMPELQRKFLNWMLVDLCLIIASLLLIMVFCVGFYDVAKRSYNMGIFVVRQKAKELEKENKQLRDVLPEQYFKTSKNES